jgi:hypothetical protein
MNDEALQALVYYRLSRAYRLGEEDFYVNIPNSCPPSMITSAQ